MPPTKLHGPLDAIVLLGSSCLKSIQVASKALAMGMSKKIVVSGGLGHSTSFLVKNVKARADLKDIHTDNRPEADILADILVQRFGVNASTLIVENVSTNCGANAWETKRVLHTMGIELNSAILIQDPTMQRRTHASFERAWRGERVPLFVSYAPFVPEVIEHDGELILSNGDDAWDYSRFVSLVLGEIPRILDSSSGYGPLGADYIEHVDIPITVIEAHERLTGQFPQLIRA